jgi:uncharacterized protein (DUF1697 family)
MNELKAPSEQFILEQVFYFYTPGFGTSAGRACRTTARIDATARNWRTVGKMLEMAGR